MVCFSYFIGKIFYFINNLKVMKKFYITFGQSHNHLHADRFFNKDCVACIEAETYEEARRKAFRSFNDQWCFIHEDIEKVELHYYSRGIIELL